MDMNTPISLDEIFNRVRNELERSQEEYQHKFNSPEEAYGIIRREYLELEEEFQKHKKGEPQSSMFEEAMQVAAMCVKLLYSFWGDTEKYGSTVPQKRKNV